MWSSVALIVSNIDSLMFFRAKASSLFFPAALFLFILGCGSPTLVERAREADDPDYQDAKDLLARNLNPQAISKFQGLIHRRKGNAPESHLELGLIYLNHLNDPVSAIYHFNQCNFWQRSLGDSLEVQRSIRRVEELIGMAEKNYILGSFKHHKYQDSMERIGLLDTIDQLRKDNDYLNRELSLALQRLEGYGASPVPASSSGLAVNEIASTATENEEEPVAFDAGQYSPPPAANQDPLGRRFYTVKDGDSLFGISREVYGDGNRWREILAANEATLPDEKKLKVGMRLVIP